MSRKSYLNDFKMNAEGKYIYTGAVYTLQKRGLKVKVNGFGLVEGQDIPAGSLVAKGKTITLTLKE